MLFTLSYKGRLGTRNAAIERFLKTGGSPPAGVKMIGRWHDLAGISGFSVAETNDPSLMAKWALDWNDLLEIDVRSVVTDELAGPLLASVGKT